MKGIIFFLTMLAFNLSAQDNDSLSFFLRFEKGYFFSKKVIIEINGEKTSEFTIKTIPHLATSFGRYDIHIKNGDEVTVKIGALTRKKIDISKIKDGFIYVNINRILFFDIVSYDKKPTFYD
jgi:hypothetical protein